MIGYITLGTNDINKATAFYDALFTDLDVIKKYDSDGFVAWAKTEGQTFFAVVKPYDGKPATAGNGAMISLLQDSPEIVSQLHAKALSLGAVDEGAPGLRAEIFYCAYIRDMDGNKLNLYCPVAQ